MNTQNGGDQPSFPIVSPVFGSFSGMTMRQYYKSKALQAMNMMVWDREDGNPEMIDSFIKSTAFTAGKIADAMIAEDEEFSKANEVKK